MTTPLPPRNRFVKHAIKAGKHLFVGLHYLLISLILLISASLYIAYRSDGLSLLNTYVLVPLGIHSIHTEGSLSEGFSLYGLHSDAVDAKTLTLDYNLTTILKGEHIIDSLVIDGLQIHLDDFIGNSGSPLPLPLFNLKSVTLTNVQLISKYPIELDLSGQNGSYDGNKLNFASLHASIKSRYASGALQGKVSNNALQGSALIYPNAAELNPHVGRFTTLPSPQKITIQELSPTRAKLHTAFHRLDSLQDPSISLQNIVLEMDYLYKDDYLNFDAQYTLLRDQERIQTTQQLRYALTGVTTSTLKGFITSSQPLPAHLIEGIFRNDAQGIVGKLTLADTTLSVQSGDHDLFAWNLESLHHDLTFLPFLPEALKNSPLSLSAKGSYTLKNKRLSGNFNAHHNHGDINGSLRYEDENVYLKGNLLLSPDAPTWSHSSLKPPKNMEFSLTKSKEDLYLNLNGPSIALSLEKVNNQVKGSGNYLGTYFDISGLQSKERSDLTITSLTPSLWKTLTQIKSIELSSNEYYDAEVRTLTHLTYDTTLRISTDIEVPWYAAVLDSQRQYAGVNNMLSIHYDNGTIVIDKYRLDIANHDIRSQRPSTLHINEEGNLIIDEIWLFDALRLSGIIDTHTFEAELALHSDRFRYEGPEGEMETALDLLFTRDTNSVQTLTGNILLLNGTITYLPLQQFKVMDDDVIIIQDVRPPSDTSLFMNIQVTSQNPIHYLTKELDVLIQPDITLWKEPKGAIQVLGMVTIPKGTATTAGKKFAIQTSHLYFGGGESINPYLDFTIGHEVDYKKIQIYITHFLDSPIFLFSSDPFMSQNDIMSYLLFGSPADAALNTDRSKTAMRADASNFMLGAGVKGLINSATKIQIDTMNILTTQEGGMGFEVGTHLNKDLRVLYKNDTVSSILIQYQLNRWLRFDADIHELGQGINAIYVKDFRDFLPHNSLQKEKP